MKTRTSRAKFQALKAAIRAYYYDKNTEIEYIERYEREAGGYVGGWKIRTHSGEMTLSDAKAAAEELADALDLVENLENLDLEEVEEGTAEEYKTTRDDILEVLNEGDWAGIWSYMRI